LLLCAKDLFVAAITVWHGTAADTSSIIRLPVPIGGQPFDACRPCAGHESDGVVTESKVSEICADDSIGDTSFSPSLRIKDSVKTYQGIITDVSWPSGNPNQCARADTPAIAGDEGGHTPFAYLIGDLQ